MCELALQALRYLIGSYLVAALILGFLGNTFVLLASSCYRSAYSDSVNIVLVRP